MTDKEFKRLSRSQLIEIIYQFQLKQDELIAENEKLARELADKRLRISQAGNIAEAALALNNVMQDAQNAAQQYLDEIYAMHSETEEECRHIRRKALEEAEEILAQARREAESIRRQSGKKAKPVTLRLNKKQASIAVQEERQKAEVVTEAIREIEADTSVETEVDTVTEQAVESGFAESGHGTAADLSLEEILFEFGTEYEL